MKPDKTWRKSNVTAYFAVPADVQQFALTYEGFTVGKGKVGGPFESIQVK
jgi:hypothetical protein